MSAFTHEPVQPQSNPDPCVSLSPLPVPAPAPAASASAAARATSREEDDFADRESSRAISKPRDTTAKNNEAHVEQSNGINDKKGPKYLQNIDDDLQQMSSEDEEDGSDGPPIRSNTCLAKFKRVANTIVPPGGLIASSFTLSSSTLGAGILGLPNAFRSMGIGTALVIMCIMVVETIFSLWLIARLTYLTKEHTYSNVVRAVLGRGPDFAAAIFMLGFCFGGAVAYIITIGDIMTPVFDDPAVPEFLRSISGNRLITSMIWLVFILPLTLPKHIDSLRFTSLFGVFFVIYFVICIIVDCGKYLHTSGFREDVHYFNEGNTAFNGLGTIMFAFLVQINAVELAAEADVKTPARMVRNSTIAMCGCGVLYICAGLFGYMRFGEEITGSILLMYQPREASVFWLAYLGLICKVCLAFALHQIPLRDGIYHFFSINVYRLATWKNVLVSTAIALVCLIVGLFAGQITIVTDLVGSLCGAAIGFCFPAIMIMYTGNWHLKSVGYLEYFGTWILLFSGVAACCFGTGASIMQMI